MFTQEDYIEFGDKIGFTRGGIMKYLDKFTDFIQVNYPQIVSFFSGKQDTIDISNVNILNELITESNLISEAIINGEYLFEKYKEWEMVDYLEDVRDELIRITKTSKFLRSSKTNYNFTGTTEFQFSTSMSQSLEDVSFDVLGDNDYDEGWMDIAIRNDLSELDYDGNGGEQLYLGIKIRSFNSTIKGVIDNITGEKSMGIDLKKEITIDLVEEDLMVLNYNKTAIQSVQILSNLMKGEVPEFKTFGRSNIVGTSSNAIGLTTLVREMVNVFSSDDTLTDFSVKNIKQVGVDVSMEFTVSPRIGETITQNTIL